MAEFVEKILFQPMTKYNKMNKLDVRWQYGLFVGVATKTNMVSGPDGNERAWSLRRLPEDRRWDVEAVMSVKGSPSGTEFELRIIAGPF